MFEEFHKPSLTCQTDRLADLTLCVRVTLAQERSKFTKLLQLVSKSTGPNVEVLIVGVFFSLQLTYMIEVFSFCCFHFEQSYQGSILSLQIPIKHYVTGW